MSPTTVTEEFTVKVTIEVKERDIADLLCSAFEGGSNYWIDHVNRMVVDKDVLNPQIIDGEKYPKYASYPLKKGGDVKVTAEDSDAMRTLNRESIQIGLNLMAEKSPSHFGDFMNENADATTADVFLQYVIFGEIIYG